MYTIPFNTAKKIIFSIDEIVDNNEEEIIEELTQMIGEYDSYNDWAPGLWMKVGNYLGSINKLKELVI